MERSENFPGSDEVHKKRCAADPLYHLFYFPERDEFSATFLDKCITLLHKKYGSAVTKDDLIQHVFGLLRKIDDHDARVVAILCILAWEQEVADVVRESLVPREALHGSMSTPHFRKFRAWLAGVVPQLIQRPFNENNVIQEMTMFKDACIQQHWLGTNLPRN